jgi:hypothetical protein
MTSSPSVSRMARGYESCPSMVTHLAAERCDSQAVFSSAVPAWLGQRNGGRPSHSPGYPIGVKLNQSRQGYQRSQEALLHELNPDGTPCRCKWMGADRLHLVVGKGLSHDVEDIVELIGYEDEHDTVAYGSCAPARILLPFFLPGCLVGFILIQPRILVVWRHLF